jgi:hypothetical protein
VTTVVSTVAGAILGVAISLPVERLLEWNGPRRPFEDTHFLQKEHYGLRSVAEDAVKLSPARQRTPRVLVGGNRKPGARFNARRGEIRVQQRLIDEAPVTVLWGVFAHELGRLILSRTSASMWRYVAGLAGVALPSLVGVGVAFGAQVELSAAVIVFLAFILAVWLPRSRRDEIAADVESLKLVELETVVEACEWMGMDPGWTPPTWISAHPSTATRVAALKAAAAAEEAAVAAEKAAAAAKDRVVIDRYWADARNRPPKP